MTTSPAETESLAACPCCGSFTYDGSHFAQAPALLAVCDVLVVRALETVGKRIVRADRSRFARLNNRPWHLAHTLWQPSEEMISKALQGAWDVVPAMLDSHGCCGVTSHQTSAMLDSYVRDLLITGRDHNLQDLRYRFETRLNIPITVTPEPYSPELKEG